MQKLLILSLLLLTGTESFAQFATSSVLSSGEIYKFRVENSGVYQVDYDLLNSLDGIDVGTLDPNSISILGNGGGYTPMANSAPRVDDLAPIPVMSQGLADGSFDQGDRMIFYIASPDEIIQEENSVLHRFKNPFDRYNYIFISIHDSNNQPSITSKSFEPFDSEIDPMQFIQFEEDKINILDQVTSMHGSGLIWYGDIFRGDLSRSYADKLHSSQGVKTDLPSYIKIDAAARSGRAGNFNIELNQDLHQLQFGSVNLSSAEGLGARPTSKTWFFNSDLEKLDISINTSTFQDQGWLNYIAYGYYPNQMEIETYETFYINNYSTSQFKVTTPISNNIDDLHIWNVSKETASYELTLRSEGSNFSFSDTSSTPLQTYVAFRANSVFEKPELVEKIENQNLHAMRGADVIAVYHPLFESQVIDWVQHKNQVNTSLIEMVNVEKIYNEFSGGAHDPTAIRDFMRMLYTRDNNLSSLVIFGRGSFDYRGLNQAYGESSFVPMMQTRGSLSAIDHMGYDDYFTLLDSSEGQSLRGNVDIAVGRISVSTQEDAQNIVDKIKRYESSAEAFGNWRLRNVFLADDQDHNRHVNDADRIAEFVRDDPMFNIEKIYLDAFRQESGAGGVRIPDANKALNDAMFRGNLVSSYLGHGGPFGMAQERVLDNAMIRSWTNTDKLSLYITATCTFAPYDDPSLESAGELLLNNEKGGAIGLLTTTRPVYPRYNYRLTRNTYEEILKYQSGEQLTLGDIIKNSKINEDCDSDFRCIENKRKFILLGDPTIRLAIPKLKTQITKLIVDNEEVDTIKALDVVTIEGQVLDEFDQVHVGFNGVVEIDLYAPVQQRKTLGNDGDSSPKTFNIQEDVILKGKTSVSEGKFSLQIVLPKAIDTDYGEAKFSVYAYSKELMIDGAGFKDVVLGGVSDNDFENDEAPKLSLFIDDRSNTGQRIVGPNPQLIADVSDDIGIYVGQNIIGQEMIAVLDGDRSNPIILNPFYEPDISDFRRGSISYGLSNLTPGIHELMVRVWDVTGNFTEETIKFEVRNADNSELFNLSAYPNPFANEAFLSISSNLPIGTYDASLFIWDISGKQVIERSIDIDFSFSTQNKIQIGEWIQNLPSGVYLAQIKLSDQLNNEELKSNVSKLIKVR